MRKVIRGVAAALFFLCLTVFSLIAAAELILPESVVFYDGANELTYCKIYGVRRESGAAVNAYASPYGRSEAQVRLFGVIPAGSVKSQTAQRRYVRVSGELIGLRIYTQGVLVVGMDELDGETGELCPAADAGLRIGDRIVSVNGAEISSSQEFIRAVSQGGELKLCVERGGENIDIALTPAYSEREGRYRCGIWVRDSTAGIGTLTFCDDSTNMFACLGHAVCDSDVEQALKVGGGELVTASPTVITKGVKGEAGQISGSFDAQGVGELLDNNEYGVYGTLSEDVFESELYPVAADSEVRTGGAEIICTLDSGGRKYYDIEIEKISYSSLSEARSMTVRITDAELLSKTGGIVQGMSGSPIIQNGMLVGAVTHVFLNDPSRGYAVFAQTMLQTAENVAMNKNN